MYLPAHFAETRPEVLQALVRRHPLGLLVTQGDAAALAADPVPFLLDAATTASPGTAGGPAGLTGAHGRVAGSAGTRGLRDATSPSGAAAAAPPTAAPCVLRAHVARANPLWRTARRDVDSLVVFQGPQAYVSPSSYPGKVEHGRVVPTWNYIVVQARGRLRVIDDDAAWLHAFVSRLTERHESPRTAPWAVTDAPPDYVSTMLRAIVGIEIDVVELTGKWKVSQNRPAADRQGVADRLRLDGHAAAGELSGEARSG